MTKKEMAEAARTVESWNDHLKHCRKMDCPVNMHGFGPGTYLTAALAYIAELEAVVPDEFWTRNLSTLAVQKHLDAKPEWERKEWPNGRVVQYDLKSEPLVAPLPSNDEWVDAKRMVFQVVKNLSLLYGRTIREMVEEIE